MMTVQNVSLPVETVAPLTKRQVWGPWATAGFGLAVGVLSAVFQVLPLLAFIVIRFASDPTLGRSSIQKMYSAQEGLFLSFSTVANAIIGVGLIMLIIKLRRGMSITEYLGFRHITKKTVLGLLAITAGMVVLFEGISFLIRRPPNEFMVRVYSTSVWPALLWIAIILLAPIFEETLFRGFLFEGFRQSRLGVVGAIGLTALVWSSLHAFQYDFYDVGTIFIAGIVLGIARFKTNSLWSTMVMHAFMNLIAMVQLAIN